MTEPQFKEEKFIVPWGHIAARTYGSAKGKPVLMVHGRSDNAGTFARLMKYLPMDNFYYVCIDLPGHGWSSHFPSWLPLDYTNYIHALHFIVEALKWKTFIYIGHSLGGQMGLVFSIFQPHRIKKIIIIDAFLSNYNLNWDFVTCTEKAFASSIAVSNGIKPIFYTKEEILHALRSMRLSALNSEAADALFERAVTEVNGKYKYNRDIRLKSEAVICPNHIQMTQYVRNLSVPIYLFVSSNGIISLEKKRFNSMLKEVHPNTKLQIIDVDGNHDVHNNNPESIAPFIREILINDNSSKL